MLERSVKKYEPMSNAKPVFPALVVYDDDSVGAYTYLEDWTEDVDQWYWSSPSDYLIDSTGMKFVQSGRDADQSPPSEIPKWKAELPVDEDLINALVTRSLGQEDASVAVQADQNNRESRIRHQIERVVKFEAK